MIKKPSKNSLRVGKQARIRKKISGTNDRPRLCVYKSLSHTYAQIIDDVNGLTLVAASTNEPSLRDLESRTNIDAARKVGELIANKAKEKGISSVVFDRSGYKYHGRIAALAEAARENGLEF